MFKFIAFILLSIFATYMESSLHIKKEIDKSKKSPIPISNQLPA